MFSSQYIVPALSSDSCAYVYCSNVMLVNHPSGIPNIHAIVHSSGAIPKFMGAIIIFSSKAAREVTVLVN